MPKVPGGGTASVSCLFTWWGTKGDFDSLESKGRQLQGWRRYVSSLTREGRVTIVLTTYAVATVAAVALWKKYNLKKKTTTVSAAELAKSS